MKYTIFIIIIQYKIILVMIRFEEEKIIKRGGAERNVLSEINITVIMIPFNPGRQLKVLFYMTLYM